MKNAAFRFLCLLGLILAFGCHSKSNKNTNLTISNTLLHNCNLNLSRALVERHFTPPVAARNYAYPNIAVYQAIMPFYKDLKSLEGQLAELENCPKPDLKLQYDIETIILKVFTDVALIVVYNDTIVSNFHAEQIQNYKEKVSEEVFKNSLAYASQVSTHIIKWASKDKYKETRNFSEYAPGSEPHNWKPTAPDYMPAIEPYWNYIRPFVLDSASQFKSIPPTTVSFDKNSSFMAEAAEVYQTVNNITSEQREIAAFWDCNPNISHHHGHFMFFLQKISPGGHWMHIALQIIRNDKKSLSESAEILTMLSVGLHDAFIACWDEKYRTNYVRPETVIKDHINKEWEPILQTPPFPEYPSGHSVASSAAATILTHLLGENYGYVDSTELDYDLPTRKYASFREAANEACISRLYGGIHYRPAIKEGIKMGNAVGDQVIKKLKTKNS